MSAINYCFGERISGLWSASKVLAKDRGFKVIAKNGSFRDAHPSEIRALMRKGVRLGQVPIFKDPNRRKLDALCAFFSIEGEKDTKRLQKILRALPVITLNYKKELDEAYAATKDYDTWNATYETRFMPLALAVVNILKGNPVFDRQALDVTDFEYMRNLYPHYQEGSILQGIPLGFSIKSPEGSHFRFLDIGSSPKAGGAPTLNLLKRALDAQGGMGISFEFFGTDKYYPKYIWCEEEKALHPAGFYFQEGRAQVAGITYLDAQLPEFDIFSNQSSGIPDKSFHFISLCRVLTHIKNTRDPDENKKEEKRMVLFDGTGQRLLDDQGGAYTKPIWMWPAKKRAIERLLNKLTIGGLAFIDIDTRGFGKTEKYYSGRGDRFAIFRRQGENDFVLYQRIIPFRTDDRSFDYLLESEEIKNQLKRFSGEEKAKYEGRLKIANDLAFAFQTFEISLNDCVKQLEKKLRNGASLDEVLAEFVQKIIPSEYRQLISLF